jgi:hypothetical protein
MELAVLAVALVVIVIVVAIRAIYDPSRTMSGMWRYRTPDWPTGVQEDDDAKWSWTAPRIRPDEPSIDDAPAPGDEGLTVDVAPIGYEVRSPDRERS